MSTNAWIAVALVVVVLGVTAWWVWGRGDEARELSEDVDEDGRVDDEARELETETTGAPRVNITAAGGGGAGVRITTIGLETSGLDAVGEADIDG